MTSVEGAIAALAAGELVVYPTDTLYGLGCRAADADAVERLRTLKGLGPDRPVSLLYASLEATGRWVRWTPIGQRAARALLPGPVTLVTQASGEAPRHAIAADGSVGVRVVDRPEAVALSADGPILSTSTNLTGQPPATTIDEARAQLGERVAAYVDVGTLAGPPSTVIDVRGEQPRVLREGALSLAQVMERIEHG